MSLEEICISTVTMQTRFQALCTFLYDSAIWVKGKRFSLTGFQPWEAESTSIRALLSHETLAHQKATCYNHAQKSLNPYLPISQPCKQISIFYGMCTCGIHSHHLLAVALLQDLGAVFSVSIQPIGKPCEVLQWIMVSQMPQSREVCVLVQDTASRSGLPSMQGLSPQWAPHLLVP